MPTQTIEIEVPEGMEVNYIATSTVSPETITVKLMPAKPKRWRAKPADDYWYVDTDGEVERDTNDRGSFTEARWLAGNYFQTRSEAEASPIYLGYKEQQRLNRERYGDCGAVGKED